MKRAMRPHAAFGVDETDKKRCCIVQTDCPVYWFRVRRGDIIRRAKGWSNLENMNFIVHDGVRLLLTVSVYGAVPFLGVSLISVHWLIHSYCDIGPAATSGETSRAAGCATKLLQFTDVLAGKTEYVA